jgi:hypothetical protein
MNECSSYWLFILLPTIQAQFQGIRKPDNSFLPAEIRMSRRHTGAETLS